MYHITAHLAPLASLAQILLLKLLSGNTLNFLKSSLKFQFGLL